MMVIHMAHDIKKSNQLNTRALVPELIACLEQNKQGIRIRDFASFLPSGKNKTIISNNGQTISPLFTALLRENHLCKTTNSNKTEHWFALSPGFNGDKKAKLLSDSKIKAEIFDRALARMMAREQQPVVEQQAAHSIEQVQQQPTITPSQNTSSYKTLRELLSSDFIPISSIYSAEEELRLLKKPCVYYGTQFGARSPFSKFGQTTAGFKSRFDAYTSVVMVDFFGVMLHENDGQLINFMEKTLRNTLLDGKEHSSNSQHQIDAIKFMYLHGVMANKQITFYLYRDRKLVTCPFSEELKDYWIKTIEAYPS